VPDVFLFDGERDMMVFGEQRGDRSRMEGVSVEPEFQSDQAEKLLAE
jgi:hypothetical protein